MSVSWEDRYSVQNEILKLHNPAIKNVRIYELAHIIKISCVRKKAEEIAELLRSMFDTYIYTEDNTWYWGKICIDLCEKNFTRWNKGEK